MFLTRKYFSLNRSDPSHMSHLSSCGHRGGFTSSASTSEPSMLLRAPTSTYLKKSAGDRVFVTGPRTKRLCRSSLASKSSLSRLSKTNSRHREEVQRHLSKDEKS